MYLQCVLASQTLFAAGVAEFKSNNCQAFYRALLKLRRNLPQGRPAGWYNKLLKAADDKLAVERLLESPGPTKPEPRAKPRRVTQRRRQAPQRGGENSSSETEPVVDVNPSRERSFRSHHCIRGRHSPMRRTTPTRTMGRCCCPMMMTLLSLTLTRLMHHLLSSRVALFARRGGDLIAQENCVTIV